MKSHPSGTIAGKSRSTVNYKQQLPRTERGAESKWTDRNANAWHEKCATHGKHTEEASTNETYTRHKLLEESTSPGLQKNKPGTTEMPKTEGAQLACEETGPPGPAA